MNVISNKLNMLKLGFPCYVTLYMHVSEYC